MTILEFVTDERFLGLAFKRKRFRGDTWRAWKAFLAVLFGLHLDADGLKLYRACTGRETPPSHPFTEAFVLSGRRSGKSHVVAAIACYVACCIDFSDSLSAGEVATIPIFASTVAQSKIIFGYVLGFLEGSPMLRRLITAQTKDSIQLTNLYGNKIVIEIFPSNFRSSRGRAIPCALLDEICFFEADGANTVEELLTAIRPSMLQFENPLLLAISSAWRKTGPMYTTFQEHYGKDGAPILFWKSTSLQMNLSLSRTAVALARLRDPQAARSEFDSEFRDDISNYISDADLAPLIVTGRRLLPRVNEFRYFAHVDQSGGKNDSAVLCVAHREKDKAVLDFLSETRPPFVPDQVAAEHAKILRHYGVTTLRGDRYASGWAETAYQRLGLRYEPAELSASDYYLEFLPLALSGRVVLLDHQRMCEQFTSLERRPSRTRDLVTHPPNGHDDISNCVSAVLSDVLADDHVLGVLDLHRQTGWSGFADEGAPADCIKPRETFTQQHARIQREMVARRIQYPNPMKKDWDIPQPGPCPRCASPLTILISRVQAHCNQCANDYFIGDLRVTHFGRAGQFATKIGKQD